MFPPFYRPNPEAIQVHERKVNLEKELLKAGIDDYSKGATLMEGVIADMEKSLSKLAEVTESSQKLLDLYLCEDKKQARDIRKEMLKQLGVLKAEPCDPREQSQAPTAPVPTAATEDPAIVCIQPSSVSPSTSSVPSLVTCPSREESDSDCEIVSFTPLRRKRTITECEPCVVQLAKVKPEPVDPVAQLAIGAQNLLLQ